MNMGLCDICAAIDFFALPRLNLQPVPGALFRIDHVTVDKEHIEVLFHDRDLLQDNAARRAFGGLSFRTLTALNHSSRSCPLCSLVQAGMQRWINAYKTKVRDANLHPMPKDEPLFLTDCWDGPQGFLVWARNPHSYGGFYLIAAVGFSAEASSPAASLVPRRPFNPDSQSTRCLEIAARWISACAHHHAPCVTDEAPPVLPSRVLDLGRAGDMIKLVNGSGRSARYACLSYRWGSSLPFVTSRETLRAREAGFRLDDLPKTLSDAVTIARYVGLRYIWIDCLCICQGDTEDWARESGQMANIYSRAHVVLSADRSTDSACGMFHNRNPRITRVVDFPHGKGGVTAALLYNYNRYFFAPSPYHRETLSSRGWALQERVLAQRILHYSSTEMSFECAEGIISEEGIRFTGGHTFIRAPLRKQILGLEDELGDWELLVMEYGSRRLTKLKDKLPAMSGLAKAYKDRLGGPEYVAGLWGNSLVRGLSWRSINGRSPFDCYTGPSWSWASYDGTTLLHPKKATPVDIASAEAWSVTLKEPANPFGEVTNAWVRLHGPLVPLMTRTDRSWDPNSPHLCWVRTPYSSHENAQCFLDHSEYIKSGTYRDWDMRVMLLQRIALPASHSNVRIRAPHRLSRASFEFFGLVIRVFNAGHGGEATMRRVGYMVLRDDTEDMAGMVENKANWTTVTLI